MPALVELLDTAIPERQHILRPCQSLTYGHYSKGERLRKDLREYREYIGRLRYSNEVMKLISGESDRKGSARAQRR